MTPASARIRGTVLGGVVVFNHPTALPEGAEVEVKLTPTPTPNERVESEAWEALSDEAWSQIDWGEGEIARDSG